MSASKTITKKSSVRLPRVLVVSPTDGGRVSGLQSKLAMPCRILSAASSEEALKLIAAQKVELLVTDIRLPDGDGLQLVRELYKASPASAAVVTAAQPSLDDAVAAIRCGAVDFVPGPVSTEVLSERVRAAMLRQREYQRSFGRIDRLRKAVRRLNEARRVVGKKVDLLCNDLVSAYGELSRQMDLVRTREDFRKLCQSAADLEQLLCHAMDWVMRRVGYANTAVWLAADEGYQLGAYIKYTIPSSPELAEAIRDGILVRTTREGAVRLSAEEATAQLTAKELRHLRGQAVLAVNCSYLGESLAGVILFRDGACPFTNDDLETLKLVAPVFAVALASAVRPNAISEGETAGEEEPGDMQDADWWKRGEAPPF